MQIRRGKNYFRESADVKVGRSTFNRSFGRKMTFDASYIYPCFLDPVWPGDTMTLKTSGFCRIFSPLDAPVMDNIELETFFFFIPNRILWEHWEDFLGYHADSGAQDTTYTIPVLATGMTVDHDNGTGDEHLAAYMGLPHGLQTAQVSVNALPFRAYNKVMNDWFRSQDLANELSNTTGDGPDPLANFSIFKSCKKHDYFTSALPYLQKGDAQTVALTGAADVLTAVGIGTEVTVFSTDDDLHHELSADTTNVQVDTLTGSGQKLRVDFDDDAASIDAGVDINALRYSLAIQRLLEQRARGGTRYVEVIKAQFGVTSPDFRLARSEFLGGGKSYINVSPVANQAGVDSTNSVSGSDEPQGMLRGIGAGRITGGFAKSFTEHGYVLGLIRARGDLTYFQGVERHWLYSSEYDYYTPALAHLGEQTIKNIELYCSNSSATDDAAFGYQERWAELRTKKSEVVGKFNPDVTGALSHWHLAEDFASLPTLNTTFIRDNTPMSRVTTVDTEPDFIADIWYDYKCARPLPVYSIPSLIGGRF